MEAHQLQMVGLVPQYLRVWIVTDSALSHQYNPLQAAVVIDKS